MRKIVKVGLILICLCLCRMSFESPLKAPMVSVVMSSYNREVMTERAMSSLINQTYKDFEILVFDDGSSDNTLAVLNDFAYRDKRVKVFHNAKNKGLVYNLNKGIDMARGKYIVRMDDDDVSLPERIEKQVEFMEKYPQFAVAGTAYYMNDKNPWNAVFKGSSWSDLRILSYMHVPVVHPTTIIRKRFLDLHHIRYDARFKSAEDAAFWASISFHNGKITNMSDLLLIYTTNSDKYLGYYSDQANNYIKFLDWSLGRIIPANLLHFLLGDSQRCYILEEMIKNDIFNDYNILPKNLKSYHTYFCGNDMAYKNYVLRTPKFRGVLIQKSANSNKACFLNKDECVEIIDEFKHVLKIKYQDKEYSFVKTKAGYYVQ